MEKLNLEHPPIEVDPMADFELARKAMEEQMQQLNEELCMEREARCEAEQARDLMGIQRDTARKERDEVVAQSEQNAMMAGEKIYALKRQINKERDEFERERNDLRRRNHRPIAIPCMLIAGFAMLALLIGVAVDRALVAQILGEPLGYGAICICAFFGGIVWDRTEANNYGNKKLRNP